MAVVVPRLAIGGTEQHLLDVLPKLDRRRFTVTVLTTRGPGALDEAFRNQGIAVRHAVAGDRPHASVPGSVWGITRLLRRERPDIVHFFLPEAYLVGGLCAVALGCRPRVMSRRSLNLYQRRRRLSARIERWLHRRMDLVLANSDAVAAELAREGVPQDRLRTVYSGIDPGRYDGLDRTRLRRELAIAETALVFVCVANLIPYKGHDDLLRAFALAAPELPDGWTLLIVGRDQGLEGELRCRAQELGLATHVRWMGERTDVPDILAASDVAVLSSHEEGMPKSILEAMAAGLPVVATRVGGTPEAVADGETGLIVAAREARALADALIALAGDGARRERFGRAGRQRVDRLFRLEGCVARYQQIYADLLDAVERPNQPVP